MPKPGAFKNETLNKYSFFSKNICIIYKLYFNTFAVSSMYIKYLCARFLILKTTIPEQ